jgi:uncharacterized protein YjbK
MESVELEIRNFITKNQYGKLKKRFDQEAKFFGEVN